MRPAGLQRRLAALAVVAALPVGGCSLFREAAGPQEAARGFLEAWARGDPAAAAALTDDPPGARAGLDALRAGLAAAPGRLVLGDVATEGDDRAAARYTAEWTLAGVARPWRYEGSLPLVRSDDAWRVQWGPSDLHPDLAAGQRVRVVRVLPERAALHRRGRPAAVRPAAGRRRRGRAAPGHRPAGAGGRARRRAGRHGRPTSSPTCGRRSRPRSSRSSRCGGPTTTG